MIHPVEITHHREHKFVKESTRGCGHILPSGRRCGKGKTLPMHHGPPPSLNVTGAGYSPMAYHRMKDAWQARFIELLIDAELPINLKNVLVEGHCCFPDRIRRDQGNYRYLPEKALGDALVQGGWLADDTWDQYQFANLTKSVVPGECWIRLVLMPNALIPS